MLFGKKKKEEKDGDEKPKLTLDGNNTLKNDRQHERVNNFDFPPPPPPQGAELRVSADRVDGTPATAPWSTIAAPPGILLFLVSSPMFARAYYLYHRPLESLLERIARRNNISINDITKDGADIGVRRAAGLAVAGRGLSVATYLSFGCFGLLGGTIFLAMGWNTLEEGISATRRWGNSKRKKIDKLLGVEAKRVDEDHPDVKARNQMTRKEETEYLANRYWRIKEPSDSPEERGGGENKSPKQ